GGVHAFFPPCAAFGNGRSEGKEKWLTSPSSERTQFRPTRKFRASLASTCQGEGKNRYGRRSALGGSGRAPIDARANGRDTFVLRDKGGPYAEHGPVARLGSLGTGNSR